MVEKRPLVFTNDLDGVHFVALPPLKTGMDLLRGRFKIPSLGQEVHPYTNGNKTIEALSWLSHRFRPYRREAATGIEMFRLAAELYGREMRVAVLSGRQGILHQLTIGRLKKAGKLQLFEDVYLNKAESSSGWKEATVQKLLEAGNSVVHIDDDLRPALRIARLDSQEDESRVLVYLLRNFSSRDWLLRRAGLVLPPNVVRVDSFRDAGIDFTRRLRLREF